MDNQRVKFSALIIAVAVITIGWITVGTGTEEVPYVTIEELVQKQGSWTQDRFRMGGLVEAGSIVYSEDNLRVDFVMQQDESRLHVAYKGLPPDMFADDAEIIIEGEYNDGIFAADNLMTKCASRYEEDLTEPDHTPQEVEG
jgi:cytochrome c-type biogenesis protein CcmE